jgi:hypothetical protein
MDILIHEKENAVEILISQAFWFGTRANFRSRPLLASTRLGPWIKRNPLKWWGCCRFSLSELILSVDKPAHKTSLNNIARRVGSSVDLNENQKKLKATSLFSGNFREQIFRYSALTPNKTKQKVHLINLHYDHPVDKLPSLFSPC